MSRRHHRTCLNWTVRVKIWIEQKGRIVLGQGGFELLDRLRTTGSLSEAARQMGMSYRHAWGLIQAMNEAAGTPLISGQVGGLKGGGSASSSL